tara:strand:- start:693 stop:1955 length:1263 start_codon:yes stop_codon:yes gene_type:complete
MALTQVSTNGVKNGSLLNADINASAAIDGSKINPSFTGNLATSGTASIGNSLTLSGADPVIYLNDSNHNSDFAIFGNGGAFTISDTTNTADRLTIISDGKIGIGRTSPNAKLEVGGSVYLTMNTSTPNEGNALKFQAKTGGFNTNYGAAIHGLRVNDTSAYLRFDTGGQSEKMRLDANGRLGIGTNNPSSKLDIHCGTDNTALQITSTDAGAFLSFFDNTGASSIGHQGADLVLSCDPAGSVSNSSILLQVDSNNTRMTIHNNGNVTIADGDLVIGTNGHGIDFSASGNNSGQTSELLDDYEEGTCNPTQINGSFTVGGSDGRYTKVGRLVTWMINIQFDSTSSNNHIRIGNFPFTAAGGRAGAGIIRYSDDNEAYKICWHVDGGAASSSGYYLDSGASVPAHAVSQRRFDITFVYEAAS